MHQTTSRDLLTHNSYLNINDHKMSHEFRLYPKNENR